MGRDTQVYNEKNILEVPLGLSFIPYLLNSNYEKLARCNPTFRWDEFFSILLKYWQVSKYTVLLNEFRFPKKRKNQVSMVNLGNGGTKDFVELWKIIHLKIWTHFSISQTKLFWINLKHYSQTCSNEHLCKMTTRLRQPMLSPPKQIPGQSLPTTLFCLPNEKKAV